MSVPPPDPKGHVATPLAVLRRGGQSLPHPCLERTRLGARPCVHGVVGLGKGGPWQLSSPPFLPRRRALGNGSRSTPRSS